MTENETTIAAAPLAPTLLHCKVSQRWAGDSGERTYEIRPDGDGWSITDVGSSRQLGYSDDLSRTFWEIGLLEVIEVDGTHCDFVLQETHRMESGLENKYLSALTFGCKEFLGDARKPA